MDANSFPIPLDPQIAAFGGMFLLSLFLDWVLEDREIQWLSWLERPLARIGKLDVLSTVIAMVTLICVAMTIAPDTGTIMVAGTLGLVTYQLVNGLGELFESAGDQRGSAVFLFLYLEVIDASFSFDGVVGAFAVTQNIFLIAAGLGIGAMYIRSMTVYLVRKGTLSEYVYLEHGAHWAIGSLAVVLLLSMRYHVPEVVTGLIGVGFIGWAFAVSVTRNRRGRKAPSGQTGAHESIAVTRPRPPVREGNPDDNRSRQGAGHR